MSSPSNKTEKDSKEEDLSSSIVNERIEALHCEMMDPSIIPRYLERAQLLWREAEQGHQSRTRDRSQSSLFSFSLSSYPWRLQIVSSSLADNAVSKTNEKDEVPPVQPANNHTDNRIFVDDPAIDYLELRRRQNQQWADQQYQTGIQAQAAGKIQAAQQAFVAGLELVPNHQALQQALQDLRQMASRRTQRSGMDSSAVPPPPSSGILRRSGLAEKSQRSQQDALLEKSLLLSSNARRDKSVAGGEDSKYPLLPNDDDEDSSSSENTEERRRRRRKKREKRRKRKSKHEHKRRKRKRRYYDSSSDDDSSSESSNRKNSDSRDRRKRHKRRHHERSPAGSAEPQKDEQTAGDRTQEKKSPISKGDSNSRRKRRRRDEEQSRKHKRRKRGRRHRDDVDAASVCSNNDDDSGPSDRTVDSLKLIHVPHTKRRRQRKEDGY